jgi:hypothetical protein
MSGRISTATSGQLNVGSPESISRSSSALAPGKCPDRKFGPIGHAHLLKNLTHVDLNGTVTEVQLKGDFFVQSSLAYEVYHLILSKGEALGKRPARPRFGLLTGVTNPHVWLGAEFQATAMTIL